MIHHYTLNSAINDALNVRTPF